MPIFAWWFAAYIGGVIAGAALAEAAPGPTRQLVDVLDVAGASNALNALVSGTVATPMGALGNGPGHET